MSFWAVLSFIQPGRRGTAMRVRLFVFLLACVGMAAQGEDFSAAQVRFYTSATRAVDVELSRYGTYTALADGTEGNSVRVLDENWELLWRHRQQVYWAGTFKHPTILQFAGRIVLTFSGVSHRERYRAGQPENGRPDLGSHRSHRNRRLPWLEPRRDAPGEQFVQGSFSLDSRRGRIQGRGQARRQRGIDLFDRFLPGQCAGGAEHVR